MKAEKLKLYNKYKYEYVPNWEFIYIGKGNDNCYWFICKCENYNFNVGILNNYGLNSEQIIKDLNLETYINNNGEKRIKGYTIDSFHKDSLIYLKPLLKDKLKNILNR